MFILSFPFLLLLVFLAVVDNFEVNPPFLALEADLFEIPLLDLFVIDFIDIFSAFLFDMDPLLLKAFMALPWMDFQPTSLSLELELDFFRYFL